MPIKIKCDECGYAFTVADYQEGERVACPECGGTLRVPNAEQTALQRELDRFSTREISPVDESLKTDPHEEAEASEEEVVEQATPPAGICETPDASDDDTDRWTYEEAQDIAGRQPAEAPDYQTPSPEDDDVTTGDMPPAETDVAAQIAKESAMFAADEHDEPAEEPTGETPAQTQEPQFRIDEEPAAPEAASVTPVTADHPPTAERRERKPSALLPRAARVLQVVILVLIALALVECFENSWRVLSDRPASGLRAALTSDDGAAATQAIPVLAARVRLALFAFLIMMALRLTIKTRLLPVAYGDAETTSGRGMSGLLGHSAILAGLVGLVAWTAAEIDQPTATVSHLGILCAALLLGTAVWMLLLRIASGIRSAPLTGWFISNLFFGGAIVYVLLQGVPIADYGAAAAIAVLCLTNSAIAITIGGGFFFGERGVGKGMKSFAVLVLMLLLIALISLYLGGVI